MAGDWIKMRTSLLTNPRVNGIARGLECNKAVTGSLSTRDGGVMSEIVTRNVMRHVTVSSLLVIWGAANEHTKDGVFRNADLSDIDDMVGIPSFGESMAAVGWAIYDEENKTVTLPNFNEYNTSGSERSATSKTAAQRQKEYRDRTKDATTLQNSDVTRDVTSDVTRNRREEKRREEKSVTKEITHTLSSTQGSVTNLDSNPNSDSETQNPSTPAGEVCKALKLAGMAAVSPMHPELLALLAKGVTVEQFADAGRQAAGKAKGFAYMLGIVKGQVAEANAIGSAPGMPEANWEEHGGTIRAKAKAIGFEPWGGDLGVTAHQPEPFALYTARLRIAVMAREVVTA